MDNASVDALGKEVAAIKQDNALTIARLESDRAVVRSEMKAMESRIDASLAQLSEDMAKRDAEHAKRDKDNLRWQVGLWIAAVVIVGVLIRWPG